MKVFHFLFFCLIFSATSAQKSNLNFKEIKTSLQDPNSKYFYERLVFRFRYDPTMLDSLEMKHLYYGKFYSKYKSGSLNMDKINFVKNFKSKEAAENIKIANNLLFKDPTDLEVLAILLQVYTNQNEDTVDFGLLCNAVAKAD
ncbi:DUF4919 domain-containing protein [Halpernia sp. GG3]